MDFQNLLNKWKIKCDINILLSMWNEKHRFFHTLDHLNDIIDQINKDKSKYKNIEYEILIISALFHDCIYDPMKNDNEEKSADFFEKCCSEKNENTKEIKNIILNTKYHKSDSFLSDCFNKYDMNIVERDFNELLKWEEGIHNEYKSYNEYKEKRLLFLESLIDKYPNNMDNILKLIDFIKKNYK